MSVKNKYERAVLQQSDTEEQIYETQFNYQAIRSYKRRVETCIMVKCDSP